MQIQMVCSKMIENLSMDMPIRLKKKKGHKSKAAKSRSGIKYQEKGGGLASTRRARSLFSISIARRGSLRNCSSNIPNATKRTPLQILYR